jgi:hypothetical protein
LDGETRDKQKPRLTLFDVSIIRARGCTYWLPLGIFFGRENKRLTKTRFGLFEVSMRRERDDAYLCCSWIFFGRENKS